MENRPVEKGGLGDHIQNVVQNVENSLRLRYEIWKLKAIARTAETASSIVSVLIILFIGLVAFTVLSIGLAYWLGLLLKNTSYGFFIVGGFYVIVCVLIFVLRNKIIKAPMQNFLLDKFEN